MEGQTGNTLNSHRLIALAGQQGLDKQDKLVELLFRAYFTEVRLPSFCCCPLAVVHSAAAQAVIEALAATALRHLCSTNLHTTYSN